jgi:hypothetical protein
VTPCLDGADLASSTITTSTPIVTLIPFTTGIVGRDLWIKVACASGFEFFEASPVVLQELPQQAKYHEIKPQSPSPRRRRFGGLWISMDSSSAIVTVTPVLDGVDQTAQTFALTSQPLVRLNLVDAVVGRDLWAKLSSSTAFEATAVQPIVLEELPQAFQGQIGGTNAGYAGAKVLSGIRVKACTFGAPVTITPVLDGISSGDTLVLTSDADEPTTDILNFTTPVEATDIALSFSDDTELYEWEPVVLYRLPMYRRIWDTGQIDIGASELVWISEIELKVKTPVNLSVSAYIDDMLHRVYTASVGEYANRTTVINIPCDREFKGRVPRLVVTGASEFQPYWLRLWFKGSGNVKQKASIKVTA